MPWLDDAHRALAQASAEDVDVARDTTWLYVYTSCLFFSFLTSLIASNHIRKLGGGDEFRSAVRFVTTSFLMCTSIHAFFGTLFYGYLIFCMDSWIDNVDKHGRNYRMEHQNSTGSNSSSSYYVPASIDQVFNDSSSAAVDGGIKSILTPDDKKDGGEAAFLSKLTHDYKHMPPTLTLLLSLENIFFVLGAYWIFLLTRELYKLAKTTHDRGDTNERKQIRTYACGAMVILLGFFASGFLILAFDKGRGVSYRFLNLFEFSTIILSILYSCVSLLKLKFTGRKNEHIHGMLMASPLYKRLKMIMIVCILFTLPYSILQLMLLGMEKEYGDCLPDYFVGFVTALYYLFGSAQALVMGGSQQCCLRILYPIIPAHVRNSPQWRAMQGARRNESTTIGTQQDHFNVAPLKPVFVNTDIESSSALWAQAPQHVIDDAQRIHDDLLRATLPKFHGYEITTAGDAFQLAFHSIGDAVAYCLEVQVLLVQAKWPSELDGLVPSTKTEREFGGLKCTAIFRGLRIRMGIHDTHEAEEGALVSQVHPVTGKTLYIGASELIGREISDLGFGGQIVLSKRIASWLRANEDKVATPFVMDYYGAHEFCALDLEVELYALTPKLLEARRKIFQKRRAGNPLPPKEPCQEQQQQQLMAAMMATPTSMTGSSGDTGEDSTTEFRAQRSPPMRQQEQRNMWTIV